MELCLPGPRSGRAPRLALNKIPWKVSIKYCRSHGLRGLSELAQCTGSNLMMVHHNWLLPPLVIQAVDPWSEAYNAVLASLANFVFFLHRLTHALSICFPHRHSHTASAHSSLCLPPPPLSLCWALPSIQMPLYSVSCSVPC